MTHAPDRVHSLRRVGVNLQTRRSLVLGGALVIAVLAGAGMVAWAASPVESPPAVIEPLHIQPAPVPANQNQQTPPTQGAGQSPAAAGNAGDPGIAATAKALLDAAVSPTAAVDPSRLPIDHGPATVSLLGPGDSGFGWPSTAFGSSLPGN